MGSGLGLRFRLGSGATILMEEQSSEAKEVQGSREGRRQSEEDSSQEGGQGTGSRVWAGCDDGNHIRTGEMTKGGRG